MQLDSFVDCEGLNRFGRFSFNNYNKEVEVHVLWLEGRRWRGHLHSCYDYCSVANMISFCVNVLTQVLIDKNYKNVLK